MKPKIISEEIESILGEFRKFHHSQEGYTNEVDIEIAESFLQKSLTRIASLVAGEMVVEEKDPHKVEGKEIEDNWCWGHDLDGYNQARQDQIKTAKEMGIKI